MIKPAIRAFVLASIVFGLGAFSFAEAQEFLSGLPKQAFHELTSEGDRIGKTEFSWSKESGQLKFVENSVMKVTLFAKPQTLETKLSVMTDNQLQVQSFEYQMKSSDSVLMVSANRVGENLRLEKTQAGRKQLKNILIQEPMLLSPMIRPFLLMRGLPENKKPQKISALLLEPSALTTLPMDIEVKKTKGKRYNLSVSYLSHSLESQIDDKGRLIWEKTDIAGLPVLAKPVTSDNFKKAALKGTRQDLVEQAKVPFEKLKDARTRSELTVKISGVPLHGFQLNRHRQKLNGDILNIKVESKPKETEPVQSLVGKKGFERYLRGDISIPVFDPTIQKKAKEIVGKENDLWKRALLVHKFVNKHLRKDPFVSLPDALEALESGKGDCNEHSVLFTALARAAGIPTRMVVGLVYSDIFYGRGNPGFYYHAWVEVFTGKEWVSMDPTWDQFPVDATHIAFVEGGADQQIQIAALMGKIRLKKVKDAAVR